MGIVTSRRAFISLGSRAAVGLPLLSIRRSRSTPPIDFCPAIHVSI
jgi:hypothetical protein